MFAKKEISDSPDSHEKTPPERAVWLNSKEAADYLRMSAGALNTAVCRGQLASYKWRRRLYFKRIELDRMLESSRNRLDWRR